MVELGSGGVLEPGRWLRARALGWMVALFLAVGLITALPAFAFLPVVDRLGDSLRPFATALLVIAGVTVAVVTYWAMVRQGERRRPAELSTDGLWRELATGLAIGFGLMLAVVGVMGAAGWVAVTAQSPTAIWRALALTVQSGVGEEVLFRLVVLRLVWRAFGLPVALVLSAALFGAAHLVNTNATVFAAACIALEAGVMLAAFYILTGRLWMAAGVHAGWNFTQGWLLGATVSGTGGFAGGPLLTRPAMGVPEWLSGGAFGPEASLSALVLCTAVGVWVLRRATARATPPPDPAS